MIILFYNFRVIGMMLDSSKSTISNLIVDNTIIINTAINIKRLKLTAYVNLLHYIISFNLFYILTIFWYFSTNISPNVFLALS